MAPPRVRITRAGTASGAGRSRASGQRGGELGVRRGRRRDEVHRAVDRAVLQQEADRADLVVQRDPRHVLRAIAEPGAEGEPKASFIARAARPTGTAPAGPRMHDPRPRVAGRLGGGLPFAQDLRRGTPFRVAPTRPARPHRRRRSSGRRLAEQGGHAVLGDGAGQYVGRHAAAVADRLAARAAPGPVRDANAVQVDHGVDTVERARRRRARRAGPSPARRAGGLPPDQAQHFVPAGPEVGDKGGSDQAGRTGHDDAHAAIFRLGHRRASRRATSLTRSCRTELIVWGVSGASGGRLPPGRSARSRAS